MIPTNQFPIFADNDEDGPLLNQNNGRFEHRGNSLWSFVREIRAKIEECYSVCSAIMSMGKQKREHFNGPTNYPCNKDTLCEDLTETFV